MKTWQISLGAVALTASACGGGAQDASRSEGGDDVAAIAGVHGVAAPAEEGIRTVIELTTPSVAAPDPTTTSPVIDQLGLDFVPRRIFVPVGDTIVFTNSETVTHNVRILRISDGEELLDAETDPGETAQLVVEDAGGYEVLCDHHAGMRAFFYGTRTPYAAFAEPDGSFEMPDVPDGTYTASTWSVDPGLRVERTVQVSGGSAELDLTP